MSSSKLWKTELSKISKFLLVIILISGWIYSGWPQIGNFPPKVQEIQAATSTNSPSSNAGSAWTNPTNAYTDGTSYANITAGNPSGSNVWGTYGFSLAENTIDQVRVGYDALSEGSTGKTVTRQATSDESTSGFTGTPYFSKINDSSDATMVVAATNGASNYNLYGYTAFSVPANSTITSVAIHYRHRSTTTGTAYSHGSCIKIGATRYGRGQTAGWDAGSASGVASGSAIADVVYTGTTNPATGATWTVAAVNAITSFGVCSNDSNPDANFYQADITVNYTEIDDQIKVDVSWDGGTSWTATQNTTLTNTEATYWYNVTALAGGWTPAKLADGQLQVRALTQTVNSAEVVRLDWLPVEVTYTPFVVVDTPTFTDATGTYNNDLSETITVASPASAVICYTTNGDTPAASTPGTCSTGTTYSGAVSITVTGTTLKAIGTKVGYTNSAVQSATYTLQVANPSFGTNGGSFNNDTTSTQTSTTTGAVFCQTVDGTTSPAASTPGTCSVGTTGADATIIATGKTIKVLGTKANYVNSAVQTSNAFTLTVGAITSSPGAGTYFSTQSVTLNIATTTGAVAHYTTNGDAVTCSSTTYSGAFNVATTTTVKAIGCKTNYVDDTAISDLYTVGLSTAIEVRAQNYTTSVSNITFPEGVAGATISAPYNNVDTVSAPQVFGGAGTAKPVVTLYNGSGITLTIWYNITTFTNSVVSNEYYLVNAKGGACTNASCITQSATFDADTTTGTTITAGAGNEKDFYLKTTLGTPAGKSGTSTLTILGEGL